MSLFGHGSWDNYVSYASEGECDERGFGGTAIINVWYAAHLACQPRYSVKRCNGNSAAGDSFSWAINAAANWGDDFIIESCWLEDKEVAIASGKAFADLKVYELQTISDGVCQKVLVEEGDPEEDDEDIEGCMDSNAINYDEEATTDDGSCKYEEDEEDGMDMKVILALAAVAAVAMLA